MKRFRYGLDPVCLLACAAYAANRWLIKPHVASPFFQESFNDLLLIPAALPWLLWMERRMGLRKHDQPPTFSEIFLHWIVWSLVCEWLAPLLFARSTADMRDVLAYAIGAMLAGLWWNWSLLQNDEPKKRRRNP